MFKKFSKKKKKMEQSLIVPFKGGFKYIASQLLWIY